VRQGQKFAAPYRESASLLISCRSTDIHSDVKQFITYINQPMPLPVGCTACAGWVESTQQPQPMHSKVDPQRFRTALDSAIALHLDRDVFLRGALFSDEIRGLSSNPKARSEHTVDMTTQSHLVLTAWRHVMATEAGRLLCYASDQPLQGAVHKVALLRIGEDGKQVFRWNEKLDGCLLVPFTTSLSFLLVNLESKRNVSGSDFAKAERIAEMQFYFLKGALELTKAKFLVLAPFITIEGDTVGLYLVAAVERAPNDPPQTCVLCEFDVSKRDGATRLLAVMYRLADWMTNYGTELVEGMRNYASQLQQLSNEKASSHSNSRSKRRTGDSSSGVEGSDKGQKNAPTGSNVILSGWFEGLEMVGKKGYHLASRTVWVKLWSVEDEKLARAEAEALEALAGPGVPRLLGQKTTREGVGRSHGAMRKASASR
jgi:hypothetical protein